MAANSPTRRLLGLLPRLSSAVSTVGKNEPLHHAFPKVFGTTKGDLLVHHRYYLRILKLVEDSRREVFLAYYHDGDPIEEQTETVKAAMSPLEPIRGVFLSNSIHSHGAIVQQFPLNDLHLLHNSLRRFVRSSSSAEDAIERAKTLIARANTTIGGAGLDPALVAQFHEGTARVLDSLDHFETFGPDETIAAVSETVAIALSLEAQVPQSKQGVWREGLSLVADIIGVVQVAWPVLTPLLAQAAVKLLGSGG